MASEQLPAALHADICKGLRSATNLLAILEQKPELWVMVWDADVYEFLRNRKALEESVKLQSHYAGLLNMHDGGKRHQFTTADWLRRLAEVEKQHHGSSTTKGI